MFKEFGGQTLLRLVGSLLVIAASGTNLACRTAAGEKLPGRKAQPQSLSSKTSGLCDSPPPVNLIFDTDIGPDCDDAAAVAMLHALADRCEVTILGMMSSTSSEFGAAALDAINTFYGRPNIPIGTLKDTGFITHSHYTRELAERWPNDLKSGTNASDAVVLFKALLTKQPDKSVTIVSVGPLRNARNLITSPGGRALVAQKVKEWSVMGGFYPNVAAAEWNFEQDGEASRQAIENWPTPIVFSGGQLGESIITGTRLFSETREVNPVRRAYQLQAHVGDAGRPSWDLTSVLYAVRGAGRYFETVADGCNELSSAGINTWRTTPGRGHAYLRIKMSPKMLAWEIDDLVVHAASNRYPQTPALPKDGWKASSNHNDHQVAAAIDGSFDSDWHTDGPMAAGDFVAVDMGKPQAVNRLELDSVGPAGGYARRYELYVSSDGNTWGIPITTGIGAAVTIVAFEMVTTRYFKIVQTGTLRAEYQNTDRPWNLREVSAFLEPPGAAELAGNRQVTANR